MSFRDVAQELQRPIWFCLASGPSLTQADCDLVGALHLERDDVGVAVTNNTCQLAKWADVLYACDRAWWDHYRPDFDGVKLSWSSSKHSIQVPYERGGGLGKTRIRSGRNSGYQLVNLVYLLGARLIVLVGYDMQKTNGQHHWHGAHPKPLKNGSRHEVWANNFNRLAKDLQSEKIEVINATRQTALTCFERLTIEQAIEYVGGTRFGAVHEPAGRGLSAR